MQFYDLRRFNQERILQIFGMKKAVISVTDDLNYATAREQRKSWWQDTNLPIMRSILSALNFIFFVEDTGLELQFDMSSIEALHEDYHQKVRTAERLSKLGFTANEINERLELGFENKPWRDYFYMPATLIPIGDDQPAPPTSQPNQEELMRDREAKRLPVPIEDKAWEQKAEQIWKAVTRRLAPLEEKVESKVKRVFYSMRKKILKALYEGTKTPQDVLELDLDIEEKELKRWVTAAYEEALIIGVASIEEELGVAIDFGLNDPVVVNFLAQKNMKLSGITRTIRKRVAQQLAEGASKGETINELAARIKNEFNFAAKRAKTIARTEVVGANNFARHEALDRTDYKEFRWFTALDEKVRETHAEMHGKTRKVGESWIVGGYSLRYPGDFAGPASEVINCRCIEVVVPGSL
jgi:SPP1 gp7 family putative phage head morphogenesis protein